MVTQNPAFMGKTPQFVNNDENENQQDWFENVFNQPGLNGSIQEKTFTIAINGVEGFGKNLFDCFDKDGQGVLSVQEFVGGLALLMEQKKKSANVQKRLKWFSEHFKHLYGDDMYITCDIFLNSLKSNEFVHRIFAVFDLDGNGEIQKTEFISSLDRLKCASIDSIWYRWIENYFDVTSTEERKITREQFQKILNLKKSFFSERFFAMFDTDGDGSIDMRELVNGLQILTAGSESDKLKFLFDVYDIDGDGNLNINEVKLLLRSCIEESNIKFHDDQLEELVEVIFQEFDLDQNQEITFLEFSAFLMKYPEVAENLTITAGSLLNPFPKQGVLEKQTKWSTSLQMFQNWLRQNTVKVFFVSFYVILNVSLIVWVGVVRRNEGGWVILARCNGMCLNFNCCFILVLMLKSSFTWLRSTAVGKYLPIDDYIELHKAVAVVIIVQSILHFVGHLGRYATSDSYEVWEYLFTKESGEGWVDGTAGITGILLVVTLVIIGLTSLPLVRRKGYFELFYFTHHFYFVFWTLLIIHASDFWKWFIGPGILYLAERISRLSVVNKARFGKTFIKEGIILPSNVVHLVIPRSQNFKYRPGDYILVNIPEIAKYEWHPFTISSSPDQSETIWLHVRVAGTWTRKLYDYYREELRVSKLYRQKRVHKKTLTDLIREERMSQSTLRKRNVFYPAMPNVSENENPCDKNTNVTFAGNRVNNEYLPIGFLQINMEGPYGSPSDKFFEAEHAVLISSGIGVTPFASILQTIMIRYKSASHNCPSCDYTWVGSIPFSLRKLQKVDFFWINRDQESFEWFLSLLSQLEIEQSEHRGVFNEHFLDMHIYMTSALKKEDMKALGLQLALDLLHQKKKKDLITGLKTKTKPGRPDWSSIFKELKQKDRGKVSVFYCGNKALEKELSQRCQENQFAFHSEKF